MEDPTKYGVVVMDEYGQVQRFVEKPKVSKGKWTQYPWSGLLRERPDVRTARVGKAKAYPSFASLGTDL